MKNGLMSLICLFALVSCEKIYNKEVEKGFGVTEQVIDKFKVTETEAGKPQWELEAVSARIIEEEKKILLNKPKIKFYGKDGLLSELVADKGRVNSDNYDMWGEGRCVLKTEKGEMLETSDIYYNSGTKKMSTEKDVKLIRPGEIIFGKGMEATPDLENIIIRNQRVELLN